MALTPSTALAQEQLPSAGQLVARHVQAIGGREAVLAPRASRSIGTFEMAAVGLKGQLVIVTQAPNRTVTTITVPGMPEMRSGYDGTVGWSVEPMAGPRLLTGNELDVVRENANVLAVVRDSSLFISMQTLALSASEGQPCYRVKLTWQSGRESQDCYHAETGLLIETAQDVESAIGKVHAVATMSDYRVFGGIAQPTRTVLTMMGAQQVLTISSVEYNRIDTSVIDIPEAIRRLK